jgi:hypothetical protein
MIPGDWRPVPVPEGDPRHDIGDDARIAIVQRLQPILETDGLSAERARQLAMFAAASVRALLYELGVLRDMSGPSTSGVKAGDMLARCCNHPNATHELICCVCQSEIDEPLESVEPREEPR